MLCIVLNLVSVISDSSGSVMLRLTNSAQTLMLETSQGDDLHQMLTELKRTKQSTFPAYAKGMFTAAEAK